MEAKLSLGQLILSEVFLFTGNSTAELACHNGASSIQTLFKLVLILKKPEMTHGVIFHIIHVAFTCMIDQGTDGIPRGIILEGVFS